MELEQHIAACNYMSNKKKKELISRLIKNCPPSTTLLPNHVLCHFFCRSIKNGSLLPTDLKTLTPQAKFTEFTAVRTPA